MGDAAPAPFLFIGDYAAYSDQIGIIAPNRVDDAELEEKVTRTAKDFFICLGLFKTDSVHTLAGSVDHLGTTYHFICTHKGAPAAFKAWLLCR